MLASVDILEHKKTDAGTMMNATNVISMGDQQKMTCMSVRQVLCVIEEVRIKFDSKKFKICTVITRPNCALYRHNFVCMFLDSIDKALNMFQNESGLL